MSQGKVTRTQQTTVQSSQGSATKRKHKNSNEQKIIPLKISLLCDLSGEKILYSPDEWKALSFETKLKFDKLGLVIEYGENSFLLSLYENRTRISFDDALGVTDGYLPNEEQVSILRRFKDRINDACIKVGAMPLNCVSYWTINGKNLSLSNNYHVTEGSEGSYRRVSSNVQNGFEMRILDVDGIKSYDKIEKNNRGLIAVKYKGKYGYINRDSALIIPVQFEDVHKGWHSHIKNKLGLRTVSYDGKKGCINHKGEFVIPMLYEEISGSPCYSTPMAIKKEGLWGCMDTLGTLRIPIKYQELYTYEADWKNKLFRAKINDKWGFVDINDNIVIPFIYDMVDYHRDANRDDEQLMALVKLNNKFGFVGIKGNDVIPCNLQYAENFNGGLAPVVKDDKLGFINNVGDLVIPYVYDAIINNDPYANNGMRLEYGQNFIYGVAFVNFQGKWGLIDKSNIRLTQFVYDELISMYDNKIKVKKGNKIVFLDNKGNEYDSEEKIDLTLNSIQKKKKKHE